MKLGIGIDTGGTYTDAVIYNFASQEILACAKALTTREDLSVGIGGALDGLPKEYLQKAELVSLSTTLATNACVENKGGRARLLLMGIEKKIIDWVGADYGLSDNGELFFYDIKKDGSGNVIEPDFDALLNDTAKWLQDADSLGIVELYAMKNGAVYEKNAKQAFSRRYDFPLICGHELFSELNSVQRGASTLLNAKLLPVIREFLAAVKASLKERGVDAPLVIVRSDSSLMSEEFSMLRPVETILCGPAASVLGGLKLTGEKDSVIIDMGGTTTDISLVKNGEPVKVKDGVSIGKWKTFVKGIFIDTFGLGGDSAIRLVDGRLALDTRRVTPICVAAQAWPSITQELRRLIASGNRHLSFPLHEFFYLIKAMPDRGNYSEREIALCDVLKDGPLPIDKAAEAIGLDLYTLDTQRLEKEGVLMRCGLTPTDIMHIKGDFNRYDTAAPALAATFLMRSLGLTDDQESDTKDALMDFCESVYDMVKKKMYCNIVRILLQDEYESLRADGIGPQLEELISQSWEASKSPRGFTSADFSTKAVLVGIGAPTHIFLPDVAKALHTVCRIPEYAGVANAVGAIVGNVNATAVIEIAPSYGPGGITGYTVFGRDKSIAVKGLDEAVCIARAEAQSAAADEARRRGVQGNIDVKTEVFSNVGVIKGNVEIDLGTKVIATAAGDIAAQQE